MKKFIFLLAPSFVFAFFEDQNTISVNSLGSTGLYLKILGEARKNIEVLPHYENTIVVKSEKIREEFSITCRSGNTMICELIAKPQTNYRDTSVVKMS